MPDKQVIKIGYLKITDHLILGVTQDKLKKNEENFKYCSLEPVLKTGWNEVADALTEGSIDGAFVLAPTAMDLFKSGVGIKLVLFSHKSGSILVINKAANINKIEDFRGKVVLIPYQLSVHNMLFHRLLAEKGLSPGTSKDKNADVFLEVVAPIMMPEAIAYDEDGEIAGFIVAEPFGSQAIAGGYGQEFCLSKDVWADHPCCVFVVRDEIIMKYPDSIHELVESFVQSGIFVEANPSAAAVIGASFLDQEVAVVEHVLTEPKDRITTGKLFPVIEDLAIIQDYMHDDMKIMKSKINLEKFIDTRFAKAAKAK